MEVRSLEILVKNVSPLHLGFPLETPPLAFRGAQRGDIIISVTQGTRINNPAQRPHASPEPPEGPCPQQLPDQRRQTGTAGSDQATSGGTSNPPKPLRAPARHRGAAARSGDVAWGGAQLRTEAPRSALPNPSSSVTAQRHPRNNARFAFISI